MGIQPISGVKPTINLYGVHKILTDSNITDGQKIQFTQRNKLEISKLVESKITSTEFQDMMAQRPLIKFKPIRNSFTKQGDKIILAKSLGIKPSQLNDYIKNVTLQLNTLNKIDFIPPDKLNQIKTYVYRHGTKEQLLTFLEYELSDAKDVLQTLYQTLEYHTGGAADYFVRPIHKMDNKTLLKMYTVVDDNLNKLEKSGQISEYKRQETAEWALAKIYTIQNNNKLRNAIKLYKELSG